MLSIDDVLLKGNQVFYTINNSDKDPRWIFPNTLQYPTFLSLYNTNTFKGVLYKMMMNIVFFFHIEKYFVSNSMKLVLNPKIEALLKQLNIVSFSIFTGTPGENRKIILEANNGKNTLYFMKIPTTESAQKLIENEIFNLNRIRHLELKNIYVPSVVLFDNECLVISNIKPNGQRINTKKIHTTHLYGLYEIYEKTVQSTVFVQTKYYEECLNYICNLETQVKNGINQLVIKNIQNNLEILVKKIKKGQLVKVSLAHCDFTPWNMYVTKTKIHVYDWEMGRDDAPLLFDFFHYIFQTEVLVTHHNYNEIKKEINKLLENKILKEILSDYKIDFNTYYYLYIMYNVSYYVSRYIKQEDLHIQAHWLIDVWNDALEDLIQNKGKVFDK